LVEGARLKRIVRPFLFADRRRAALSVMMAWTHDQVVLHLAYLVEEGIVHLFYAGPGEIHAAAVADEQAVPGEGVPRDEIAAGVGRVARRMNDLYLQLPDLDHHAVLKDEVLSNVAESMGGDLRAGLVGESFVVKHVIRMMVRVEDEPDRVPVLPRDLLQDAGVEARIDHGRDLGRGITDHITEVLHGADHVLFEEHRPLGKPMDRVKRSFRSKGSRPWLFGEGGSSLGLKRPLPLGVSGGEDMEARFATAASLGFLVQVAHMRHRPACYLPIP